MDDAAVGPGTPALEAVYFTDPLCPWSWAFEPQWRRLRYEFRGAIAWRNRMGGLSPGWDVCNDPVNDVSRPGQLAPQWLHVAELTGAPVDATLWASDPPASSYPACVACKAAESLGDAFAERYLRRLREAALLQARNIARPDVLLAVAYAAARDLPAGERPALDRFAATFDGPAAQEAFREDLKEAADCNIDRLPALAIRRGHGGVVLIGYRPYAALRSAVEQIARDIPGDRALPSPVDYVTYWQGCTAREVAESVERDTADVERELDELAGDSRPQLVKMGNIFRPATS